MSAFKIEINSLEDAHRLIHLLQQTGTEHRIPLIQAVLDGRIAHLEVERRGCAGRTKKFIAVAARRPTVILIGDDDDDPAGPGGWPLAERLLHWAQVVVLHATGGERWHYETTVSTAERYGRVLLVECCTRTLPAWMAVTLRLAPQAGVQIIEVPQGQPAHPVASPPEVVQ